MDGFPRPGELAVPSPFGGHIDNDGAWSKSASHFGSDQNRRFLSGYGRRTDYDILFPDDIREQLTLPAIELFAHGLGVAAFAPRLSICSFTALRTS